MVTVVDAQIPQVADMMRTVLGISAGATIAEQLARTASSLAADGREIAGILVADPEPTDRTVGAFRTRHGRRNTGHLRV